MAYSTQSDLGGIQIGMRSLIERKEILKNVRESVKILDRSIRLATRDSVKKRGKKEAWQRPTGQLMRSWEKYFRVTDGGSKLLFGTLSELPYAAIHDTGGEILPKKKYLAIPLNKGARDRGWPRDWPEDALEFGYSKSGKAFLFSPPSMAERRAYQKKYREKKKSQRKKRKRDRAIGLTGVRGLLGVRGAKRGEAMTSFAAGTSKRWQKGPRLAGEPQYLLVKSVKLPGTGYMEKAKKEATEKIAELWGEHFTGAGS